MSDASVTRDGLRGVHPGREARTGGHGGSRAGRGGRGERAMVPDAAFASYHGQPILKEPVWEPLEVAGYFFLGGLAAGSSLLAAGADLTGRHRLARASRLGAFGAISLSMAALVKDLGRPERFLNMLRVVKPTSPMSLGSWLLTVYGPMAGAAAASDLLGIAALPGRLAGVGAAALAPAVASYTAVLVSDTAAPAWHEARHELPFVFVGSAAASAGGWAMLTVPAEAAPARRLAVFGGVLEMAASRRLTGRLGALAETYQGGRAGRLLRAAAGLTGAGMVGGVTGGLLGGRGRWLTRLSGVALLAGGVCERFGIFHAGVASTRNPAYTVGPQRAGR